MFALRTFLRVRYRIAVALVALALCLKAMVQAGYMVTSDSMTISVSVCADLQGQRLVKEIEIPMEADRGMGQAGDHAKPDGTCAFTALAFAVLGGADAFLLAKALIFLFAIGFLPTPLPRLGRPKHQRPPPRGPPFPA